MSCFLDTFLVLAGHHGGSGEEEPRDGIRQVLSRGAGGGPPQGRTPRSVGLSQVGVRRGLLRSPA